MSELTRKEVADTLMEASKDIKAISFTEDEFEKYQKRYKKHGITLDRWMFNIFENKEKLDEFLLKQKNDFRNLSEIIDKKTMEKLLKNGCFIILSAGLNPVENDAVNDWKIEYKNNPDMLKLIKDTVHEALDERYTILKRKLESTGCPYYELLGVYDGSPELSYLVDLTNNGKNNHQKINSLFNQLISFAGKDIIQETIIGRYGKQEAIVYCGQAKGDLRKLFHNKFLEHHKGWGQSGMSEMRHEMRIRKKDFSRFHNEYDFDNKKPGRGF